LKYATQSHVQTAAKKGNRNQVFDAAGRRARGLWIRNGVYYAQTRIGGQVKQIALQEAKTVPEARLAMQALKRQIRSGEYPPKEEKKTAAATLPAEAEQLDLGDRSIVTAIATYREERDGLKTGDIKTRERENSGLKFWTKFCATLVKKKTC